jgi:hypothetical protein
MSGASENATAEQPDQSFNWQTDPCIKSIDAR